jgi:hypothetical protein
MNRFQYLYRAGLVGSSIFGAIVGACDISGLSDRCDRSERIAHRGVNMILYGFGCPVLYITAPIWLVAFTADWYLTR